MDREPVMEISRVGLAVIGDEVLQGEVPDENLSLIGKEVVRIGAELALALILPDDRDCLVRHLSWMKSEFDWLVVTGGIGTTHDDLTRDVVSKITGRPLRENERALRFLENRLDGPVPERLRMLAMTPEGADPIDNAAKSAQGFLVENIIVFPGIPSLVESMLGVLGEKLAGRPVLTKVVFSDLYESRIARCVEDVQASNPEVRIGSYPATRKADYRVKLVLRSRDHEALEKAETQLRERIAAQAEQKEE
jgi:molybdopterin-biosynthesis enzyme MoeA-like protein